ncbi:EF-hand domain-containing protein [Streptomyces sp. SID9727]|uniref:EF-hand domain-containing protein n=1 Tax=Streptomyces sp. SID9727 TaxID=2706114 RepID=UPI0013C761D2|nr:EF-hand domain-containing protein [Streptomyces sp. SID9727]NEC68884.1 calcium-binding protein [Streptomyces sp. SID9727]
MREEAIARAQLVFKLFDADENGVLEADDFELMAKRVVAAAPGADAGRRSAMVAAFRNYWATLAEELDSNRDGRVDYAEFQSVVLAPERFSEAVGEFADALTAVADPDGDGLVERSEFAAVMTAIGFDEPNIHALFDSLEPTGTEQAAVPAWTEAIKEYYRPDAAGIADHLVTAPAS